VPCKALERRVPGVHGAKSNTAGHGNSPVLTVYALVNLGYLKKDIILKKVIAIYRFNIEGG